MLLAPVSHASDRSWNLSKPGTMVFLVDDRPETLEPGQTAEERLSSSKKVMLQFAQTAYQTQNSQPFDYLILSYSGYVIARDDWNPRNFQNDLDQIQLAERSATEVDGFQYLLGFQRNPKLRPLLSGDRNLGFITSGEINTYSQTKEDSEKLTKLYDEFVSAFTSYQGSRNGPAWVQVEITQSDRNSNQPSRLVPVEYRSLYSAAQARLRSQLIEHQKTYEWDSVLGRYLPVPIQESFFREKGQFHLGDGIYLWSGSYQNAGELGDELAQSLFSNAPSLEQKIRASLRQRSQEAARIQAESVQEREIVQKRREREERIARRVEAVQQAETRYQTTAPGSSLKPERSRQRATDIQRFIQHSTLENAIGAAVPLGLRPPQVFPWGYKIEKRGGELGGLFATRTYITLKRHFSVVDYELLKRMSPNLQKASVGDTSAYKLTALLEGQQAGDESRPEEGTDIHWLLEFFRKIGVAENKVSVRVKEPTFDHPYAQIELGFEDDVTVAQVQRHIDEYVQQYQLDDWETDEEKLARQATPQPQDRLVRTFASNGELIPPSIAELEALGLPDNSMHPRQFLYWYETEEYQYGTLLEKAAAGVFTDKKPKRIRLTLGRRLPQKYIPDGLPRDWLERRTAFSLEEINTFYRRHQVEEDLSFWKTFFSNLRPISVEITEKGNIEMVFDGERYTAAQIHDQIEEHTRKEGLRNPTAMHRYLKWYTQLATRHRAVSPADTAEEQAEAAEILSVMNQIPTLFAEHCGNVPENLPPLP